MNVNVYPPLELQTMAIPTGDGRSVAVFSTWEAACTHMCNHVLAAPESEAWSLAAPAVNQLADVANADECWRLARESMKPEGGFAQPLYDVYVNAIREAAADAARLGWQVSNGNVVVFMGTSGVLVVIERQVKTAFLPGQGDPATTLAAQDAPSRPGESQTVLARQGGMTSGRKGEFRQKHDGGSRSKPQRMSSRSREEQLYYTVFRPAVQFIRSRHNRCRDITGRVLPGGDYALLKGVLPSMSRLKLPHWQTLRSARNGQKQERDP